MIYKWNQILALSLPIALVLDLIIPFLLAPAYKGYQHMTQVMSVLGNDSAPLHVIYNIWLIVLGIVLIINDFQICKIVSQYSTLLGVLLFVAILIYAIGGCILSGLFSVGETKTLDTFSQKVHGYGSVIGFMILVFTPLLFGIYGFKAERMTFAICSLVCFVLAIISFVFFVLADKPNFQNTMIAYEGLWQRLSLMFMYIPMACVYFMK